MEAWSDRRALAARNDPLSRLQPVCIGRRAVALTSRVSLPETTIAKGALRPGEAANGFVYRAPAARPARSLRAPVVGARFGDVHAAAAHDQS